MSSETIILIHGLCGSRLDMWPIARQLRRRDDFRVINWSYRTLRNRIETHARRLQQDLAVLDQDSEVERIQIVTHSMGGIILRQALAWSNFEKLSRILMLAPPHQGSHVARKLSPLFGWYTPSLKQLSDSEGSFVNRLPNPFETSGIEFAIVEAKMDRVIKPGKVLLDGHSQFAQVNGQHGILTWYPQTIRMAVNYVCNGCLSSNDGIVEPRVASAAGTGRIRQAEVGNRQL